MKILKYYKSFIAVSVILILSFLSGDNADKLPTVSISHLDKIVHLFMYFSLSIVLIFDLLRNTKKTIRIIFIFVLVFVIFLGGFTELIQGNFIEKRAADIADFIANISGCIIAIAILKNPLIFSKFHRHL